MTGIQFITDAKGRKTAAVSDLKKHRALWEDIEDGLVSESRRKEKGTALDTIKADLVNAVGCVPRYAVDVKPSARKALEALPDRVLARHPHTRRARAGPTAGRLQKADRLRRSVARSGRGPARGVHDRRRGDAHQHHAHREPPRRVRTIMTVVVSTTLVIQGLSGREW